MILGFFSSKICFTNLNSAKLCLVSNADSRPGLIFRECDHIYEQLFGYEELGHNKEEGCWRFEAMVNDKMETGIHCACHGDSCNGGDILESDVIEVNATTPVQP